MFLAKNGVAAITALVDELTTGNTLAYALSALQTAMSYDFSWEFPNSFVEKILSLTGMLWSSPFCLFLFFYFLSFFFFSFSFSFC